MTSKTTLINRLDSTDSQFQIEFERLLRYEQTQDAQVLQVVTQVLAQIKSRRDAALIEYTERFDRWSVSHSSELEISDQQLQTALLSIEPAQRLALEQAAARIRSFHERQRADSWSYIEADGTRLGQRVTPLERAGLYVPGGKAAYPSSVLMNAIPAKVAGVGELIMVCPTPDGVRNSMVLAAAALAGVDRVFAVGGAQAVGALAYGTALVPRVDKIVGPGNAYVAQAKRQVFGLVGIDMIAGPSEILIIADGSVPADWIAMDLFSQAEHDELAQAILLCPDAAYLDQVASQIERLLPNMPRSAVIATSLKNRGMLIKVRDLQEACVLADSIAGEHLEIACENPQAVADKIHHAGAIFLGRYSSESLGDYCAGPNHVLPTMRTSRFSSPLGVYDFQKRSSIIEVSRAGAQTLGPMAATLAFGEGLQAHAHSALLRVDKPLDRQS
jgi:histidinol dehydrogenase